MEYIAKIHTPFPEKFGIPRQSGLAPAVGKIVFEPKFRNPDAVKGIEEFSHLWLLWEFSRAKQKEFHATVAPPRLGGKERRGVFATRSPFRPNSIGLSCVRLMDVRQDEKLGPVLTVSGVDLLVVWLICTAGIGSGMRTGFARRLINSSLGVVKGRISP